MYNTICHHLQATDKMQIYTKKSILRKKLKISIPRTLSVNYVKKYKITNCKSATKTHPHHTRVTSASHPRRINITLGRRWCGVDIPLNTKEDFWPLSLAVGLQRRRGGFFSTSLSPSDCKGEEEDFFQQKVNNL